MIWEKVEGVKLNIIDNIGRVVYSQSVPDYSLFQDVKVSNLSSGLYFIELNDATGNTIVSSKLVKQ